MRVLCFNTGSSGLRVAAFDGSLDDPHRIARSSIEPARWRDAVPEGFIPEAVAHRIVRGTKTGLSAEAFTDAVRAEILASGDLAPTHDPRALELLEESRMVYPHARQFVAYDTAFHATIPPENATYAIPQRWRDLGIRRVGYHGLSCAYAAKWLRERGGSPRRAICAHLGNGCSVTALLHGRSCATTMGFTPLEGVVMGTRSGSIDPGALLFLQSRGIEAAELREALFRESGLLALCGSNDMREIERRDEAGDARAALAMKIFVQSVAGAIAQMASVLGGVDALTFAGGIGLHSAPVRERVCRRLSFMGVALDAHANAGALDAQAIHAGGSRVAMYALDVEEERMMVLALSAAVVTAR